MLVFGISGSVYLFFDVEQFHFKEQAHTAVVVKERLETIKLSLNEFAPQKNNDEVWVNGMLYDVSSYEIVNDTAIITVFHDNKEENLVKTIVENIETTDKYTTGSNQHVSKYHIVAFNDGKILVTPFLLKALIPLSLQHSVVPYANHYEAVYSAVIKPPPNNLPANS